MTEPRLKTLDLSFFGQGEVELWIRKASEAGFSTSDDGDGAYFAAVGSGSLSGHYIAGEFQKCGDTKEGDVHWRLNVLPTPESEPPEDLTRMTEKFGGIEGALAAIGDLWPSSEPVDVRATLTMGIADLDVGPPGGIQVKPFKTAVEADGSVVTLDGGAVVCSWKIIPPYHSAKTVAIIFREGRPWETYISGVLSRRIGRDLVDSAKGELSQCLALLKNT